MKAEITSPEEIARAYRLDGFADVYWNLGQVLAWIWTRSPFPVDAYSNSSREMASRDHSAHPDLPFDSEEIADRGAADNGLPRQAYPCRHFAEASRVMLLSFQSGELIASGQPNASLMREDISTLMWADMVIDPSISGEMIVRHRRDVIAWWKDVRVRREDVLKCFPADLKASNSRRNTAPVSARDEALLNLPPDEERFPVRPQEGDFDPDKLSHWSITMTLAWIVWGDISAVREEWDSYRSQCAEWRFFPDVALDERDLESAIRNATLSQPAPCDPEIFVHPGQSNGCWKFASWGPSGWLGIEFKARRADIPWQTIIETLWLAAGEGRISATALEHREGERDHVTEIPPHMWVRLRRTREASGKAMLSAPDRDYRDVRFTRTDVKALWPTKEDGQQIKKDAAPSPDDVKPPRRIAQSQIEPTFKQWRAQHPAGHIPSAKQDYEYMKGFGVSRKKVRDLIKKFGGRGRGDKLT